MNWYLIVGIPIAVIMFVALVGVVYAGLTLPPGGSD